MVALGAHLGVMPADILGVQGSRWSRLRVVKAPGGQGSRRSRLRAAVQAPGGGPGSRRRSRLQAAAQAPSGGPGSRRSRLRAVQAVKVPGGGPGSGRSRLRAVRTPGGPGSGWSRLQAVKAPGGGPGSRQSGQSRRYRRYRLQAAVQSPGSRRSSIGTVQEFVTDLIGLCKTETLSSAGLFDESFIFIFVAVLH